jgi:carboxypeptidase A1
METMMHRTWALVLVAAAAAILFAAQSPQQEGANEPAAGNRAPQAAPAPRDAVQRFDDHKLILIDLRTQRELMTVLATGAVPWACRVGVGQQPFSVSPEQLAIIDAANLRYDVLADNVQRLFDEEAAQIAEARQQAVLDDEWFAVYRTSAEVNAYIDELVVLRPDLVEKLVVGTSIEGRTIYAMRITAPGAGDKPAVLFNGMQHSREWVAVMVPMYIADRLVRNYGSDPRITAVLDAVEVYIVPIVNPDGYEFSQTPGNRLWRKNRRNNPGSTCYGVDLNRNWDIDWGGPHSTSSNPCSDIFFGSGPHSEPEVAALAAFMGARPNIAAHIDYHSYSQLVLHPWGYTTTPHPNINEFGALSSLMSQAIYDVHGVNYVYGTPGQVLYMVSGSMLDWTTAAGAFGYTIELRPASANPGFQLPPAQILPTAQENFAAALVMAEFIAQGVVFGFPDGLPSLVHAGGGTTAQVTATSVSAGALNPATAVLYTRVGSSGGFNAAPMMHLGGSLYEATFPAAPCGVEIEFYFEIDSQAGGSYRAPLGAPSNVFSALSADIVEQDLLAVDFAGGLPGGWSATGLWHTTSSCPVSGSCEPQWAYYGQSTTCNYNSGGANNGVLTSPEVAIPALDPAETAELRFCYNLETEDHPSYDKAEISINGGSWIRMSEAPTWTTYTADVSPFAGQSITLRWRFDTVDGSFNNYRGWQVTAVRVTVTSAECPDPGCIGDLNGDDTVDVLDLLILLDTWGPCAGCAEDLNGDGTVDVLDLLILLDAWGPC